VPLRRFQACTPALPGTGDGHSRPDGLTAAMQSTPIGSCAVDSSVAAVAGSVTVMVSVMVMVTVVFLSLVGLVDGIGMLGGRGVHRRQRGPAQLPAGGR
jgi:hypothetical protein